jgi:hypothetical protein
MDAVYAQYGRIMGILAHGSRDDFEALSREVKSFPHGVDDFIHRHWITNAIHCGSNASVEWMLEKRVDLSFRNDEGYTVLHSAIDRDGDDRYEVLEALLTAGAPVNAHGINDWTPPIWRPLERISRL